MKKEVRLDRVAGVARGKVRQKLGVSGKVCPRDGGEGAGTPASVWKASCARARGVPFVLGP